MARGTTLAILINDLRSEIGHSLEPSLGKSTRDVLVNVIQRNQRRLWDDYAWPFLRVQRDCHLCGQRCTIAATWCLSASSVWNSSMGLLGKGRVRRRCCQYNQHDSDEMCGHTRPAFDAHESNQIEVWPIPSENSDTPPSRACCGSRDPHRRAGAGDRHSRPR